MSGRHAFAAALAGAAALSLCSLRADAMPARSDSTGIRVEVDSTHKEIIVTAGPFAVPAMAGGGHHHTGAPQVLRFDWPIDASAHGFKIALMDGAGAPLPREILHHLIAVNFDRRQVTYPAVERLFGAGKETEDVILPGALGVPLAKGQHLGMYAAWHNETGTDVPVAYLRVTLPWLPPATVRRNIVMPLYVDVNNVIGGVTTYDIPPGKSSRSYEFTLPIGGRVVAIGGHLHDLGVAVRLEDAKTGVVLARLKAKRDAEGHLLGVARKIFGFGDDALHLDAGHPYRVVGEYENPSDTVIADGAMAHINGIFSPDDIKQWPALDLNDPLVQRDIATLPSSGSEEMNMGHHDAATAAGSGGPKQVKRERAAGTGSTRATVDRGEVGAPMEPMDHMQMMHDSTMVKSDSASSGSARP